MENNNEINKKKRVKKKSDESINNVVSSDASTSLPASSLNDSVNKDLTPNIQIFIEDDIIPEEPNSMEAVTEPAKKRGRKPKGGKLTLNCQKKNETVNSIANIILHLKCSINDLSEHNYKLNKMVKYPLEYDPSIPPDIYTYSNMDNTTPFSMYERDLHTSENKASSIVDQCMLQTPTSYLDSINYSRLNEPTELGVFCKNLQLSSLSEKDTVDSNKQSLFPSTDNLGFTTLHSVKPTQLLNQPEKFGAKDGVIGAFLSFSETRENDGRLAHMVPTNLDDIRPSLGEHFTPELFSLNPFNNNVGDQRSFCAACGSTKPSHEKFGQGSEGLKGPQPCIAFHAMPRAFTPPTTNYVGGRRPPEEFGKRNIDSILLNRDIPAYTDTALFISKTQHNSVLGGTIAAEVATDIAKGECDTTNIKDINAKLKRLKIHLYKNNNYEKKSACFWCTYDYDNPTCYIPKYEMDDKIYGYGSFCRPECAVAYLMKENIDDSMKFERYHLLNQIYSKIYDFKKNIKPAPNPYYLLEKYYGNLTIQEYRKLLKTEHMLLVIDKPLTRILPELHEDNEDILLNTYSSGNSNHTVQNNTGVYKVKRSSDKTAGPSKSSIIKDIFT